MTRDEAITLIKELLRGRDHDPFWTDEEKEGYRHACREITEALTAAGAFTAEPTITKAQAHELWDCAHVSDPSWGPLYKTFEEAWPTITEGTPK